jgi:hypothetical protein
MGATVIGAGPHGSTELKQLPELFVVQASMSDDTAHGIRINGVGTGNREKSDAVRHGNVFALADNSKACYFQSPGCS